MGVFYIIAIFLLIIFAKVCSDKSLVYILLFQQKNNMKNLIPLIIAFAFCACSTNLNSNRLLNKHIAEIEDIIKTDSTKGEDFLSFFEQFSKDTLFQQERLCLPFRLGTTVDDFETGMCRDSLISGESKKQWPFCSFLINNNVKYFHQDLVVKNDTVELQLRQDPSSFDSRKIDAGFVRKNGRWFNYSLWITR